MNKSLCLGSTVFVLLVFLTISISFSSCAQKNNDPMKVTTDTISENDPSLLKAPTAPKGLYPREERQTAPFFELPYAKGGDFTLSDYLGNVILLDFTATWCYWCDQQAPDVNAVVEKYNNQKIKFFAINVREAPEVVLEKYPAGEKTYPILVDVLGDIIPLYDIQGFPTFVLIDLQGRIAYKQSGYDQNFTEKMSEMIDYLLLERN